MMNRMGFLRGHVRDLLKSTTNDCRLLSSKTRRTQTEEQMLNECNFSLTQKNTGTKMITQVIQLATAHLSEGPFTSV